MYIPNTATVNLVTAVEFARKNSKHEVTYISTKKYTIR